LIYFRGTEKFFHDRYLAYILSKRDEIWQRWRSDNRNLFLEFRELWSGGPVILCSDMHQSFTGTLGLLTTLVCLSIVLVFFLFTALPQDYVQAFCTCVLHRAVVPCDSTAFLYFFLWKINSFSSSNLSLSETQSAVTRRSAPSAHL